MRLVRREQHKEIIAASRRRVIVAAELLNPEHPLHNMLRRWVVSMNKGPELTKRKARKFLTAFPTFNRIQAA